MKTRVKVCCISSVEEARIAVAGGADAIGLVARMPSGPGTIEDELIAEIAATIPPGIDSFLLTSETAPNDVVAHVQRCGTSVVQLVDEVPLETYAALRGECGATRIVQVIHVEDRGAEEQAQRAAPLVDAILLDSGRPNAEVPEFGGTGRQHDWNISQSVVRDLGVPVYLAGGLNAGNVGSAIRRVDPFGVDLCSGVRGTNGLSERLLGRFMMAVNEIDRVRRGW